MFLSNAFQHGTKNGVCVKSEVARWWQLYKAQTRPNTRTTSVCYALHTLLQSRRPYVYLGLDVFDMSVPQGYGTVHAGPEYV